MLQLIAPDFLDREMFCCGPTPYMRAVRQIIVKADYDMSRYHEESFGATPQEDVAAAEEQAAVAQPEEPQASHADVTIPKDGHLRTCKVRVLKVTHNRGISEEETDEGYVLSCCSRVKGR